MAWSTRDFLPSRLSGRACVAGWTDPRGFVTAIDNSSNLRLNSFLGLDTFNEFVETSQAVFPT
jgi:hypothetical protein